MTATEALKLLDEAAALLQTNRQTHARLVLAVKTLAAAIETKPATEAGNEHIGDRNE